MKFCSFQIGILLISFVAFSLSVCESDQSAVHQIDLTDRVVYSESSDRSDPILLQDAFIRGSVFIFAEVSDLISSSDIVQFYIDDPLQSSPPIKVEKIAPYDLQGGTVQNASPFSTLQLSDGLHSLTVVIVRAATSDVFTVEFNVANTQSFLISSADTLQFVGSPAGDQSEQLVIVSAENGQLSSLTLSIVDQVGADWISLSASNGILPAGESFEFTVLIDSAGLLEGFYSAKVIIDSDTQVRSTVSVSLSVIQPQLLGIPAEIGFVTEENQTPASFILEVSTTNRLPADITLSFSQPWLILSPNSSTIAASSQLNVVLSVNSAGLAPGDYSGELQVTSPQYPSVTALVSLTIQPSGLYTLVISETSNRANPIPFGNDQTVSGSIYVFVEPETGINQVEFYIDSPTLLNAIPIKIERVAPFDLAGTDSIGTALPFDTASLSDGNHVLTSKIVSTSGEFLSVSSFIVANEISAIQSNPSELTLFSTPTSNAFSESVLISTTDGFSTTASITLQDAASNPWISLTSAFLDIPSTGTVSLEVLITPTNLTGGLYTETIVISSADYPTLSIQVSLEISDPALIVVPSTVVSFTAVSEQVSDEQIISISTNDKFATDLTLFTSEPWVNISPSSGTVPDNGGFLSITISADASTLLEGVYNAVIAVNPSGFYDDVIISIEFTVLPKVLNDIYQILYSTTSDRQNALALDGAAVVGDLYVFVLPESGISSVDFVFDGVLFSTERTAPYDLQGGAVSNANAFDTTLRTDGIHELLISVTQTNGQFSESMATFVIQNNKGSLISNTTELHYEITVAVDTIPSPITADIVLSTSDNLSANYSTLIADALVNSWLSTTPSSGIVPALDSVILSVLISPEGLQDGAYSTSIEIAASTHFSVFVSVNLVVIVPQITSALDGLIFDADPLEIPPAQTLQLSTNNAAFIEYSTSISVPWATINPSSGSIPKNGFENVSISVDTTGLSSGIYEGFIQFNSLTDGIAGTTLNIRLRIGSFGPFRFNFLPFGSPGDPEYLDEYGDAYGVKQNGLLEYGWKKIQDGLPIDFTTNTRYRSAQSSAGFSDVLRGLIQMQRGDCCSSGVLDEGVWELFVANGEYTVAATVGDLEFFQSLHAVNVNGVSVIPSTSTSIETPFTAGTKVIQVTDHILRIDAVGGFDTRLSSIQIINGIVGCVPFPSQFEGEQISSLPCGQVRAPLPYSASFGTEQPSILTGSGQSTGFTMYMPRDDGETAFNPVDLLITSESQLEIIARGSTWEGPQNNHVNVLGVGIPLPDSEMKSTVTFKLPDVSPNLGEKACLFFGISFRDYIMLCVVSNGNGETLQLVYEIQDVPSTTNFDLIPNIDPSTRLITLQILMTPLTNTVTLLQLDESTQDFVVITILENVEPNWFSKDAAGIDITVGTRSYTGIHVTSSEMTSSVAYLVVSFEVEAVIVPVPTPQPGSNEEDFDWFTTGSGSVLNPTAMQFGPDEKLYVASVFGLVNRITFDYENQDQLIETFNPVPNRLLLGVTVDPLSTPDDVILWLSHSDGSQDNGAANSGKITRVSGVNLGVVQDIVVGLPRAIANHAPNQLHFGPDGRLYIAIGGNTGAGAANTLTNSEFGVRPEQPLSAALLAFDVRNPLLDFDCTPPNDPFGVNLDATGIADKGIYCDVEIIASGLRNAYDFTFVDEKLYATDNGLGVQGTHPAIGQNYQQGDSCEGRILAESAGQFNPGPRPDLLYAIVNGGYYGHPNPSRDECVYIGGNPTSGNDWPVPQIDGTLAFLDSPKTYGVGLEPDVNWRLPEYSLGNSRSANGIIAYESDAFCGVMKKDLLVTFYSQGDQVARMIRTGSIVTDYKIMTRSTGSTGGISMTNPLCITQDPLGRVFVGEFGNSRIDVFLPKAIGCWQSFPVPSSPFAVVDSGSTRVGNKAYLIGGQTSSSVVRSVLVFNAFTNSWSTRSSLPSYYPSVLSPAVASIGSLIYIVSGENSTGIPVPNAVVYDSESDSYLSLPDIPSPRSRAVAAVSQNGELYVIGGVDSSGSSSVIVEIFSPITNLWRAGPSLLSPRDSAMGAFIGGSIYVAGGRNSVVDNDALDSIAVLEVLQGQWSTASAPMPTARQSGGAVVVKGKLLVLGGQIGATGPASSEVEEYDPLTNTWISLTPMPVGKRGAAWMQFGNGVFGLAGANDAGRGAVSNQVQVFRYES